MLRYTFLLLLIFGTASPAFAQRGAAALFDETSCDFGVVPGTVLVHPFRIVNKSKQNVRIYSVTVSCGCTSVPPWTNQPAHSETLAPGQETAIVAHMDSRRFYGTFRKVTIYVRFDQPQFEEVQLTVQATCRQDLTFTPDGLHFGKVKQGAAAVTQMTVSFNSPVQTQIKGVRSESNYVVPKVQELHREMGDVTYEVSATLRPDTPAGKWFTNVWLTTNNQEMSRLRVPLTVDIEPAPAAPQSAPPIKPTPPSATPPSATSPEIAPSVSTPPSTTPPENVPPVATPPDTTPSPTPAPPPNAPSPGAANKATPANIALGDVKAGTDSERKVILRSTQPFRITSIQGADREILVQPVGNDGNASKTVHVLTVTIHANQPGQLLRMIRVRTDLDSQREIDFNAQAKIIP